ncbi:MAG: response regulator [Flavipsychrobacter sp.]|jgi:signal transduction histidine kinase/ActR/RegA family two-component response regulator|nr:response regulator [Flavipsychrobacter sp.]
MQQPLSFFNWSLRKALDAETDNFAKARIKIIFTILCFSLAKIFVAIVTGASAGQPLQIVRGFIALFFYVFLVKLLLGAPSRMKLIAQIMMLIGVVTVWTNVFVFIHTINLITLQFVFMIVLSGFYMLGSSWGTFYSIVSILPVMAVMLAGHDTSLYSANVPQQLASPGLEIVVTLNFITIIVAHYLFFKAFRSSLNDKEQLNGQLRHSVAEANSLAVSRSNFLSTISHELRTPLNAVIGTTELLIDDTPEDRQKENLKILHSSALDLLSLINNVLDFNKIDSDKLELEMMPVRLDEFVQNVCAGLRIKATAKSLRFNVHIDDCARNQHVSTDPTRLAQILYNLVGNAIKFTEQGSIDINLSCTTRTDDSIGVLFSIADTGIGIHPGKHAAIFDVFTQAESHVTRKYGGTGLGLPIVKQLLPLFDSQIELESTPGKGSRFFFTINFAKAQAPVIEHAAETSVNLSKLNILVAEDNEVNRVIIKKQLRTLNVTPVIVENGVLAYDAWLSGQFDAVLLDLHMPEADGYDTIKRIRNSKSAKASTHAIAFTASINEKEQILEAGFDDFLYKPANIKHLREKLEELALRAGKV